MSDPTMDELLRGLWERLGPEQRDNARLLSDRLDEVRRDGDPAAWEEARALAHRLAGTLGSLGQVEAGREAMAIEELAAGVEQPDDALLQRVVAHAIELRRRLEG